MNLSLSLRLIDLFTYSKVIPPDPYEGLGFVILNGRYLALNGKRLYLRD